MSYCRFSEDSDVYVIASGYGGFQIYLKGGGAEGFATRQETLNYLSELQKKGLKIPDYALNRLQEEIDQKLPEPVWDGIW